MLKLTKTGIGLLTKQYRSVLRKCWAINVGIFALGLAAIVMAPKIVEAGCSDLTSSSSTADIVACLNQNSVAIGYGTYALNDVSSWTVAIGGQAKAKGSSSVAIGDYAQAEKINSIAIGQWARSRGDYSVALGSASFTSENYVVSVGHSVGDLNYSSGVYGENLYRRIVNVAAGQNDHDVVILKQLNDALNYYYTKDDVDEQYALLEAAIGDVDDKVGDISTTGIAGNDVATQLKYILENGSTGGSGVSLSTLGYIGANTPYLNTTNNAMNFSSTYTIGGNLSTLANQIKTNENSISALNTRVNNLGTYGGTLELTDNYGKIMGDVSVVRNGEQLGAETINVKPYATLEDVNLKSYTVEMQTNVGAGDSMRSYRVQVLAINEEQAIADAKNEIANNGWSPYTILQNYSTNDNRYINKYMYATEGYSEPVGYLSGNLEEAKQAINEAEVTIKENNYTVTFTGQDVYGSKTITIKVSSDSQANALDKAKEYFLSGIYLVDSNYTKNIYENGNKTWSHSGASWTHISEQRELDTQVLENIVSDSETIITAGSLGTSPTYVLGNGTVIENIALLDSAIGDLSATGVSGNSVAAQLKLLGEVGSEVLGQKIGSWSTTKDSISQTLGEETKRYGYLTAFEYDSENEQYVGTVGDNLTALDTALSLTAKDLDALTYQLYNYYYTFRDDKTSEIIEFAEENDSLSLMEVRHA